MKILITGASRGIGEAIANYFSKKKNCEFALVARSLVSPHHSKLEGSLKSVADNLKNNGSKTKIYGCDISNGNELKHVLKDAIFQLGGLDLLVNNASMLMLEKNPVLKKRDIVHNVNARSTMICIEESLDALLKSNGKIVTISPPIDLNETSWIRNAPCYTISKYSMTLATLGASDVVTSNSIWPKRTISTAATKMLEESTDYGKPYSYGRKPEEFAKAVFELVSGDYGSGNMYLDEDIIEMSHTNAPIDFYVKK